ncbi:two-component system chemotaxis response regulator CheB [Aliiruegeria haliotis]|uniref:Protein-glutamate methylesterase/protein-glutamine glutaminase n=1 Tax=Aliiruegeria haliotis TaxID=1280846 RepID=A0A2T0RJQ7_9RHOB|nr:chemotaxis response regulator protein-glutamate methylesterase [Aliiruegeria haliotis]PRY21426.1 two-component system chemotaxis response regulator CheB [Aliiruegeria haliotis]
MKKKVVIVDDSRTMRGLIAQCLETDGRFDLVGQAADPYEAREIIKRTVPDVITLDVEMPRMDGLTFLEKIMRLRPMPVVMFSTETHAGSVSAVEALSLGAVDCLGKPRMGAAETFQELAERVFVAASARVQGRANRLAKPPSDYDWNGSTVLIGASTGGVDALERVLSGMPINCPPILISQHMPQTFLTSFAERLSAMVAPEVALARDGESLQQGQIRIAPGGDVHLLAGLYRAGVQTRLETGPKCNGHRPSVDVLFDSARTLAPRVVSVLLTGMGRDGADGMLRLRQAGAHTIGQDRESSVVYGMPRVAAELGAVAETRSLDEVATAILAATCRSKRRRTARLC